MPGIRLTAGSHLQLLPTVSSIHCNFLSRLAVVGIVFALVARLEGQETIVEPELGDETLQFFLNKSALVVLGEFTFGPVGYTTELGIVHYAAEFRIDDVLKGSRQPKDTIRVDIVRANWGAIREKSDRDRPAELTLGGRCILFLDVHGQTADIWFGVQPPYPSMVRSLKRLAAKEVPK